MLQRSRYEDNKKVTNFNYNYKGKDWGLYLVVMCMNAPI